MIKDTAKKIFRRTGWLRARPVHDPVIAGLLTRFEHADRSLTYGRLKRLADCLYCHAAPGTLEMTILGLSVAPAKNFPKLLNLGGGTGQVPAILGSLGYEVFNLDLEVDAEMSNPHHQKFDLNSPDPLPYQVGSFDIVLCQEIIEHLENPWKLFRDAKTMLRPGGWRIVSTPNIQSIFSRWRFFLTGYLHWFYPGCFGYHINPLPDWEIRLIARETGFELASFSGSGDYYFDRDNRDPKKILDRNEELIYFFQKP